MVMLLVRLVTEHSRLKLLLQFYQALKSQQKQNSLLYLLGFSLHWPLYVQTRQQKSHRPSALAFLSSASSASAAWRCTERTSAAAGEPARNTPPARRLTCSRCRLRRMLSMSALAEAAVAVRVPALASSDHTDCANWVCTSA